MYIDTTRLQIYGKFFCLDYKMTCLGYESNIHLNAIFLVIHTFHRKRLLFCMQWPFKNTSNSCRVLVYKAHFYYVSCNKPSPGKQK